MIALSLEESVHCIIKVLQTPERMIVIGNCLNDFNIASRLFILCFLIEIKESLATAQHYFPNITELLEGLYQYQK